MRLLFIYRDRLALIALAVGAVVAWWLDAAQ